MATRYSDFIKMQDFLPVYDMTDEMPEMWRTFIPTKQFCELLSRSVTAITSKEISKRRSMWVRGTFGTGKSHASSVVRHLLCDPANEVEDYIQNLPDESLKANLSAIPSPCGPVPPITLTFMISPIFYHKAGRRQISDTLAACRHEHKVF